MRKDESQDTSFYIVGWSVILCAIIYAILKIVFSIDVIDSLGVCTFYRITGGYYCPGCGATRSVYALVRGDIGTSLFYHPFIPYITAIGVWFMISQTIQRLSRDKIRIGMHFRMIYVWIAVAILIGNFIWKNAVLLFTGTALM